MKHEMMGWQWHQLNHMQIICTLFPIDNHTCISSHFFTGWMLFLQPNQQCQSAEGKLKHYHMNIVSSHLLYDRMQHHIITNHSTAAFVVTPAN